MTPVTKEGQFDLTAPELQKLKAIWLSQERHIFLKMAGQMIGMLHQQIWVCRPEEVEKIRAQKLELLHFLVWIDRTVSDRQDILPADIERDIMETVNAD